MVASLNITHLSCSSGKETSPESVTLGRCDQLPSRLRLCESIVGLGVG